MTKKQEPTKLEEAQAYLIKIQADEAKIKKEIVEIEAEIAGLDYGASGTMDHLANLEGQLAARRRALTSFRGKLGEAQNAVSLAERKEREVQAHDLILERDELTKTTIERLRALRSSLDKLDVVKFRLQSEYKVGSPDIFTKDLTQVIEWIFRQRAGFFPAEFGLPRYPTPHEAAIASAEDRLRVAREQLSDFKRRKGLVGGGTRPEDITRATEQVQACEVALRRARGETVNAVAEDIARSEAEAQAERQAVSNGIASWQQKAKELNSRINGDKKGKTP